MKKSYLLALGLAVLLSAGTAFATPTATVYEVDVNPSTTGTFHFPHLGDKNVYVGQYNLSVDGKVIGGFCIEDTLAITNPGMLYDLLKPSEVPVDKGQYNYKEAAWLFQQYGNTPKSTQVAIWEAVLDPGNYNLSDGGFKYVSGYDHALLTEAQGYLNVLRTKNVDINFDGSYTILWGPSDSEWKLEYPQNYIIPTPEPGIILLLGLGLIGVAGLKREN